MATDSRVTVDLGGTTVSVGFSSNGQSLDWIQEDHTKRFDSASQWVERLLDDHPDLKTANWVLGVPGPCQRQALKQTPNLGSGWKGQNLTRALKENDLRFHFENDANLAALGIYAATGEDAPEPLLCVTLGTGIGGGIVHEGELFRGHSGGAAEIGHMILVPGGRPCGCGNNGCFERYASAKGLELNHRKSTGETLTAREIARQNSAESRDSLQLTGTYLGRGLALVTNVIEPEEIHLAGGLSRSFEAFRESTRESFESNVFVQRAKDTKILRSTLDQPALRGGLELPLAN